MTTMVSTMSELEVLNAALAVGWVKFCYFKADGTRRLAIGTRNRALIEQTLGRPLRESNTGGAFYEKLNGYFDLTRVDWRQFRTERFIGILFDNLTNEQAVAHALTLSLIESGNTADQMKAADRLIGEMALPIMTEIANAYSRVKIDDDEIRATDELLSAANQRVSVSVCTSKQSTKATAEPQRVVEHKGTRAELIAELIAIRNRESEILAELLQ